MSLYSIPRSSTLSFVQLCSPIHVIERRIRRRTIRCVAFTSTAYHHSHSQYIPLKLTTQNNNNNNNNPIVVNLHQRGLVNGESESSSSSLSKSVSSSSSIPVPALVPPPPQPTLSSYDNPLMETIDHNNNNNNKPVLVTIRYSGESGLRPYFLTVTKKMKVSYPDVVFERRILPVVDPNDSSTVSANSEPVFEILVDGKVVIGKKNHKNRSSRRQQKIISMMDMKNKSSRSSVFVSMQELDVAIARARRRRRQSSSASSHSIINNTH